MDCLRHIDMLAEEIMIIRLIIMMIITIVTIRIIVIMTTKIQTII